MRLEMRDFRSELRAHSFRFDAVDARFDAVDARFNKLGAGLQLMSGQQNDVIPKVIGIQKAVNHISEIQAEQTHKMIQMLNRLDTIERRLKSLEERATQTESEVKDIRTAIHSMVNPVLDGSNLHQRISEIDQRITNIEGKLAA